MGQKIWRHQKYEYIGAIFHPDKGKNMEYRYLIKDPSTSATWTRSTTEKFGQLIEVLKRGITGIQMIKMVHRRYTPKDRKVTYKRFMCDFRPHKEEANKCCITVGGYRVEYPGHE